MTVSSTIVPRAEWDRAPHNRWTFQHVRQFVPTAEVWRGRLPASILPRAPVPVDEIVYHGEEGASTIGAFLDATYTDGFLVMHRGRVVAERYFGGMHERSLHLSQSVGKSLVGILVGIYAGRGVIDPDAPVTDYLPELEATAYRGATVQHVLDMTSGVAFDETYTDPYSDVGRVDVAAGWKPKPEGDTRHWPGSVFEIILGLKAKDAEHGARFSYRSIETDVLAFALERVSGLRLPEIVSRDLWQPLGAEESASYTVDPTGYGLADGGFNATLRDYARFGEMLTCDGFFNERQVAPLEWVRRCRRGNHDKFTGDYRLATPHGAYSQQFWLEDHRTPVLLCRGVFGQLIYSDPAHEFTAVKLSSWPDFRNVAMLRETLAAINAIKTTLSRRDR